MIHIGTRIREVMKDKKMTVTYLASQIPCERTNVYNIFIRTDISMSLLMTISRILGHNFFAELSEDFDASCQPEEA